MTQQLAVKDSQKKQLSVKLISLKPNISPNDRKEAMEEFGINAQTLSRYLNGDVRDIDTGYALALFFKSKIDVRQEKLSAIC